MRSLLLIPLAALSLSCADGNPGTMIILGNRAFGSGCVLSGGEGGEFSDLQFDLAETLPDGSVNLGLEAHPVVKSMVSDLDTQESFIFLTGADVEIFPANYVPSVTLVDALRAAGQHHHSPFASSTAIEPGGTAVASVRVITGPMRQVLAASFPSGEVAIEVEARITLTGQLNNGEVESQEWRVPITLYAPNTILRNAGDCCLVSVESGDICDPFVEGITCCSSDGATYCPAVEPDTCM